MSFYLIFIGWIGDIYKFYWLSEISNFNLQTEISTKSYILNFSKSAVVANVMSKIEFELNWRYVYVLYYGFGSKQSMHNFP